MSVYSEVIKAVRQGRCSTPRQDIFASYSFVINGVTFDMHNGSTLFVARQNGLDLKLIRFVTWRLRRAIRKQFPDLRFVLTESQRARHDAALVKKRLRNPASVLKGTP